MPSLPLLGAVTPPLAAAVLSQICYKEDLISSLPRPGLSPSRLLCILTLRFGENTEAVVFNHVRVHSRCPKQPSSSSRAAPPQRHRSIPRNAELDLPLFTLYTTPKGPRPPEATVAPHGSVLAQPAK